MLISKKRVIVKTRVLIHIFTAFISFFSVCVCVCVCMWSKYERGRTRKQSDKVFGKD